MAYTWDTTTAQIQTFLDDASNIVIGAGDGQYPTADAEQMEQLAVDEIERCLAPGYQLPLPTDNADLILLAAKLAAAFIGSGYDGARTMTDPANWTDRYKAEVYTTLAQMILMHEAITDATKKALPEWKRLLSYRSILKQVPRTE